jgi:hypothetical protein
MGLCPVGEKQVPFGFAQGRLSSRSFGFASVALPQDDNFQTYLSARLKPRPFTCYGAHCAPGTPLLVL